MRTFDTIEALRQALLVFRETCNMTWLIERHGFLSPAEYRRRQLQPLAQAAQASIRCPKNRGRYSPQRTVRLIAAKIVAIACHTVPLFG